MIKILVRHIRSIVDYYHFFEWKIQSRPILIHSLFVIAVVTPMVVDAVAPRDWGGVAFLSPIIAVILFSAGIVTRTVSAYAVRKTEFRENAKLNDLLRGVRPSQLEEESGFVTMPPENGAVGPFVYCRKLNKDHISNPHWNPSIVVRDDSNRYQHILDEIRKHANVHRTEVLRRVVSSFWPGRKALINESKIGLAADIVSETKQVEIYRTDYFSDLCLVTNGKKDICSARPHNIDIIDYAQNGRMPYVQTNNGEIQMREFSTTSPPVSLHIGVEVLAISKDFLFRIPNQGKGVQYAQGLRAPYASGSLDWEDTNGSDSLKETILAGARRELEEEWSGKGQIPEIKKIEVIGYFRHGERGGKPQFVCFAKLDSDDADIWPDVSENTKGEAPNRTANISSLKEELSRLLEGPAHSNDSVALYGALVCLRDACEDRPELISSIIAG